MNYIAIRRYITCDTDSVVEHDSENITELPKHALH